jgi:catechol 2,3-dioxygenase-like lactoylglutathione lyase family enzyme
MKTIIVPIATLLSVFLAQDASVYASKSSGMEMRVRGSFIALSVPDLEASLAWYQRMFDLPIKNRGLAPDGTSRFALLHRDGLIIELVQHNDAVPAARVKPGMKGPHEIHGMFKTGIVVDDAQRVHANLAKKGARFRGDIFDDEALDMSAFIVEDNNGNLIQFFSKMKHAPR